jgi:cyclopropane fatty-acyl-phospholipid synthase-like methyltransferase
VFDGDGAPAQFDIISAWEVLEHLPRETLGGLFGNIRKHLAPGGRFVASVALFEDRDERTGAVWHVTLEPREWWEAQLAAENLMLVEHDFDTGDFVRGSGNGPHDWDARSAPEMGFHIVVGHRS